MQQQQQQRKLSTKDKLVHLSESYLGVLRKQKEPFMDLIPFLEKWMPYFFPGIVLYDRRRLDLYFTLTDEIVNVTYREACVKLLSCWFPSVNFNNFSKWGGWDGISCPENYRAGLFNINMALEFALIGQAILIKEQSQAAEQVEQSLEQQAA